MGGRPARQREKKSKGIRSWTALWPSLTVHIVHGVALKELEAMARRCLQEGRAEEEDFLWNYVSDCAATYSTG